MPVSARLRDLTEASLERTFVDELPGDPIENGGARRVHGVCYSRTQPTPVDKPVLLAWSDALGDTLGLARPQPVSAATEILGGNRTLPGTVPYAARYGGHQFGSWAGQLGDGRAITLGELVTPDGSRQELQLKGAGRTAYSRSADGRAVLRSSLREFVCSEAMAALGVPTTRALSLVGTGETVVRDMFYDGHPQAEPGAIVCRVAPSFVRFGNFQILTANQEFDLLRRLVDYVKRMHAPSGLSDLDWFYSVCQRTAELIGAWMRVGFVHGVMNTDNLSILGLTIDYGPYGWMEGYDPRWTPNTTDFSGRRYAFGRQPEIAHWNLQRLAESLLPIVPDQQALLAGLDLYVETFNRVWATALSAKLGLRSLQDGDSDDEALQAELFAVLGQVETDYTIFFRRLAQVPLAEDASTDRVSPVSAAWYAPPSDEMRQRMAHWLTAYAARVRRDGSDESARQARMNAANPKYICRNYLSQQAIDALAAGDASVLSRLMHVLSRPYDEQPEAEDLAQRRPEWARHKPGCATLSCSS